MCTDIKQMAPWRHILCGRMASMLRSSEVTSTANLLRKFRQKQSVQSQVHEACQTARLRQQAEEGRRQFGPGTSSSSVPGSGPEPSGADTANPAIPHQHQVGRLETDAAQLLRFACAEVPNLEQASSEDLLQFLAQSGLSADDARAAMGHSSCQNILQPLAQPCLDDAAGAAGGNRPRQCPEGPAGADVVAAAAAQAAHEAGQQQTAHPAGCSDASSLVQLAYSRVNAWEVRRLLAVRDCSEVHGQLSRWCLALRLRDENVLRCFGLCAPASQAASPGAHHSAAAKAGEAAQFSGQGSSPRQQVPNRCPSGRGSNIMTGSGCSAAAACLVHRARQELLLQVHPDKNKPGDAQLAAAAFSFLQEAAEGLVAWLSPNP